MKKTILLSLLMLSAVAMSAQQQDDDEPIQIRPEHKAQMRQRQARRLAILKDSLALTPEQSVEFDSIFMQYDDKLQNLFLDKTIDPEKKGATVQEFYNERERRLVELLTQEQYAKYKQGGRAAPIHRAPNPPRWMRSKE